MSAVRTSLVLALAREYVEAGWTQGASARNSAGHPTYETSRDAVCWCTVGAVHEAGDVLQVDRTLAFAFLCDVVKTDAIARWNDRRTRTKDDVLKALDDAILLAAKHRR